MAPTQPPPPSPAPRPRTSTQRQHRDESRDATDNIPFTVHGQDGSAENTEFLFARASQKPGGVTLRSVVAHFLGAPQTAKAPAEKVFHILGRLRCLQHTLKYHNEGLAIMSPGFISYWRQYTVNLLSGYGCRLEPEPKAISIDGLDELIVALETQYSNRINDARALINNGKVSFSGLSELFRPETVVESSVVSDGAPSIFRVVDSYFEERRSMFGSQKLFHLSLEMVVPLGEHFSVTTFSEVFTAWQGERPRRLSEFTYQPVLDSEKPALLKRAQDGVRFSRGGANYLAYTSDSFFMHTARSRNNVSTSMSQTVNSPKSRNRGRIMVDMARGAFLGHHPCQGIDEATLAVIQLAGRYRHWLSKRSEAHQSDALVVWNEVPDEFLITFWPALVGFSFTAKTWGHVLISGLSDIEFQDRAFDRLVLSQDRKQLIRAVVRSGTIVQTQDLISGKQGGLIFLLHGPPGVGKTLTAEAVAEDLHRPLYYVTMGELGANSDDLERRLTDVLELCAEWNALAVLDEADVFLETRSTSDLVRNTMVCVMLRILEYHPGILFLTTNRVRTLDPAVESRITVAIRYEELSREDREQIWMAQLEDVRGANNFRYNELARHRLNGRQIKNTVRLALSLATDQGTPLSQPILTKTLEVTSLGRQNIEADNTWTESEKK